MEDTNRLGIKIIENKYSVKPDVVGSFVCDINFRWGVYIPGLVEIYVLSMGKRTCMH